MNLEIFILTAGAADYIEAICLIVDPDEEFFKKGCVSCRDSEGNPLPKDLSMLPIDPSRYASAVIFDDKISAWHQKVHSNIIVCILFFNCIANYSLYIWRRYEDGCEY
jgi:hypothetical protein